MTKRDDQRDEQRSRILTTALAEFNQHGFQGASTRRITAAAGVSSGLLFHYFPSKVALYEELVRFGFRHMAFDEEEARKNPLGFLMSQAESVLTMLSENPEAATMFTFMARAQLNPGISNEVDELFAEQDIVRRIVPVILIGQESGTIRPGNPEALGLAFWAALQGVAEEIASQPGRPMPEASWIVDIVKARPNQ